MYILCDTCSVLMLIRMAPDMFLCKDYGCVTIPEVVQEIFRTQKFKTHYPWRADYKKEIKALKASELRDDNFDLCFGIITNLIETGITNHRTKRSFSLSHVDQKIAAYTVAHKYKLTSTDGDLNDFVKQEFDVQTVSPMEIINDWLEKGLIEWNDELQKVVEDWEQCNEHPQPRKEVKRFIKLTGYEYVGPM